MALGGWTTSKMVDLTLISKTCGAPYAPKCHPPGSCFEGREKEINTKFVFFR